MQLSIGTKHKVFEIVRDCEANLNGFPTRINLNILPLRLHDVLIGMDWLEKHHVIINHPHKSILCTDSQWNHTKIQGIPKKVSIRKISSLQEISALEKATNYFQ